MIAVINTGDPTASESCAECDSLRAEKSALENEMYYLEQRVFNAENRLEVVEIERDQVTANMADLAEYVVDLERSLAEAHLMTHDEDDF
jgi:predicted  nucleic acid-binding Zn-ribbon protein